MPIPSGKPPRVLLVEWSAITAMAIADDLEAAGYEVVGPFLQAAKAVDALSRDLPDLAILDVTLSDGPCDALARELRNRSIPFLVHTSWTSRGQVAPEFLDVPWLEKPCQPDLLVRALDGLLKPFGSGAWGSSKRIAKPSREADGLLPSGC
jgi:DNA-binding response OmpR family regulator